MAVHFPVYALHVIQICAHPLFPLHNPPLPAIFPLLIMGDEGDVAE
jgi:hypothetical protein